jgi:hypothetical protein
MDDKKNLALWTEDENSYFIVRLHDKDEERLKKIEDEVRQIRELLEQLVE